MTKNDEIAKQIAELQGQVNALKDEKNSALEAHATAIKDLNLAKEKLSKVEKEKRESLESEVHSIDIFKDYDCSDKSDETLNEIIAVSHTFNEKIKELSKPDEKEIKSEEKGEIDSHTNVPKGGSDSEDKNKDPFKKFWEG